MRFVTLEEGRRYLRIDSDYDDAVISALLSSSEILCREVARLTDDEWDAVCSEASDREKGIEPTAELVRNRELMRVAVLYALGYLYEHREEADHHELVMTLRNLLFAIREGVV